MKHSFHYEDKRKIFEWVTLIFLILFLFYGLYKNHLFYVMMGMSNFSIFLFFVPILGVLEILLLSRFWKEKITLKTILLGLFTSILLPPSFPIFWYFLISFLFYNFYFFLHKKIKCCSFLLFYKVILLFFTSLFSIGLENSFEKQNAYFYGTIDVFFGKNVGAFGTTNLFLILVCFLVLCSYFYYKKEIPIYSFIIYSFCFFGFFFFSPNLYELKDFLNPSFFFASVFFLPINEFSPVTKRKKWIYGCFYGFLSFLFIHCFSMMEGAYLALFFTQILFSRVK